MRIRSALVIFGLAIGGAGCPPSTSPGGGASNPPSGAGGAVGTASGSGSGSASGPREFIASYRPSALWNGLTRETIPHGWPKDLGLRAAREVRYDPGTGVLQVGSGAANGQPKAVAATPGESVTVVWIPDYVCPGQAPSDSLLLATPRDAMREAMVPGDGSALTADTPKVIVAAVPVEVQCAERSDPQWVAEHSANWRPTGADKKRHRILGGGQPAAGGLASHPVVSDPSQGPAGLAAVDMATYAVVAVGEGATRVQYVHPDAIGTEQVAVVDVPLATSACRPSKAGTLPNLVYLSDDTGPERGRYRVQGAPLFVRPADAPRHELRFSKCTALFPNWRLLTTHIEPNPRMYLRLYGTTPRKESKWEDQIVSAPPLTMVGDTANLVIPLLTPITCPRAGGGKSGKAAMNEAYMVRRAVLRRRLEMPRHDGPVRLVPPDGTPYGAVEWNIDAKPCTGVGAR